MTRSSAGLLLVLTLAGSGAQAQTSPSANAIDQQRARILAADDARARTDAQLSILIDGTRHADASVRAIAFRALGRLERDSLMAVIAVGFNDADARVRAEAVNALGQAAVRSGADRAASLLERIERDPMVQGMMLETAGRLRTPDARTATASAHRIISGVNAQSAPEILSGTARALFFLARQQPARGALPPEALQALDRIASEWSPGSAPTAVRTRRVAVSALAASGQARADQIARYAADPSASVRQVAVAAVPLRDSAAARAILERALTDAAPEVRTNALRAWARMPHVPCTALLAGAREREDTPALTAIDGLAGRCGANAANLLDSMARRLPASANGRGWHRPAHALAALATVAPERARSRINAFAQHADPFVRGYAARAAGTLRDTTLLMRLAADSNANVATEAVTALSATAGRSASVAYVRALRSSDSQLLQTAAKALDQTTDPAALPALRAALVRVNAKRMETERDAQVALLERIQQLGDASATLPAIDFPVVPFPSAAELRAMESARVVFVMADGASFELKLFPWDAPTNAARLMRLVRERRWDGLTFHRVAPGFVVQGPSPGANEYAGWGPYTRDELGLRYNWRGTVGLSTRGRDTGDGQIFFNLADNSALDHDYTILGEVTQGMAVVDRLQEGARIRSVRIR